MRPVFFKKIAFRHFMPLIISITLLFMSACTEKQAKDYKPTSFYEYGFKVNQTAKTLFIEFALQEGSEHGVPAEGTLNLQFIWSGLGVPENTTAKRTIEVKSSDYSDNITYDVGKVSVEVEEACTKACWLDVIAEFIPKGQSKGFKITKKAMVNMTGGSSVEENANEVQLDTQESNDISANGYKKFKGAWFSVEYPDNFTAVPSIKSVGSAKDCESAFFKSPDNTVEFYIFSPQWDGEPSDITIDRKKEKIDGTRTYKENDKNGNPMVVTKYTIVALDGSYFRSYQDSKSEDGGVRWVIGIKFKDKSSYEQYKNEYLRFKESLIQLAD